MRKEIRNAINFMFQAAKVERFDDTEVLVIEGQEIMKYEWTEKQEPPPGEYWDTLVPIMHHRQDGLHVFASVWKEDVDEWRWVVKINREIEPKYVFVYAQSPTAYPEEEAKRRAEEAVEKLIEVAKLGLGGCEGPDE